MNSPENLHPLQQAFREQAPFLMDNALGEFVLGFKRAANFLQSLTKDANFSQCVEQLTQTRGFSYDHPTVQNIARSDRGLIAVANHPYPILDGLIIGKILEENYPGKQVKFLANPRMKLMPEIEHLAITTQGQNSISDCIEHTRLGNPLIIFPAGFSSYYHPRSNIIQESQWKAGALHIARKARVPLQPFHSSTNTPWLYNVGKYYTEHEKDLKKGKPLPMEAFNPLIALSQNRRIHIEVGQLIEATQELTMEMLQTEVYKLGDQKFEV